MKRGGKTEAWRRDFEKRFPNIAARKAADEAVEAAWKQEEFITLIRVCGIWNDVYFEKAGK